MIERFGSGAPWEAVVGYARAVRAGDRVLVSGCTAVDGDVRPVTTMVQVAALIDPAMVVEIEAEALVAHGTKG